MRRLLNTTILFLSFFITLFGQDTIKKKDNWRLFPSKTQEMQQTPQQLNLAFDKQYGKVQIFQDARIDAISTELREKPYFYGYTLQLEVSQQKSVIKNARYKILKIKPNIELDAPYESPNIYLYAGRFYDRVSAYQFKKEIAKQFPNAIVVGPRIMELPVVATPEENSVKIDSINTLNR